MFLPRGNTGATMILEPHKDPVDFFSLFCTDDILGYVMLETDRYAQKQKDDHPDENKSLWNTPTIEEMKAFRGLCFVKGITVKPDMKFY